MVAVRGPLVLTAGALGLAAVSTYRHLPTSLWLPDIVVGAAALLVAALTWRAREVPTLTLLFAATWWAGTVWPEALYWHRGVLVHLALSVPRPWPRTSLGKAAVVIGYVTSLAAPVWRTDWAALVFAAGLAVCGVVESRSRRRRGWHAVAPALLGAAITIGVLVPDVVGRDDGPLVALVVYDALITVVLCALALLVRSPTRTELTDLAVDLGGEPVQDVGALTALVQAEPGLASDTDLRAALAAAGKLERANELVREQVHKAIVEVDHSRRRLVVAASHERGRLARELTATAGRPLRDLVDRAARAGLEAPSLARAAEGLDAALLGLRAPGLTRGLATALSKHPLVTSLDVGLRASTARCDEVVEDTLYAVAVESLTNAAKYAGPCGVAVDYAVVEDQARIVITDDGIGGAVPGRGTGLVGLRDRLEALGGGLEVSSPAGAGTVIRAWAPRVLTGDEPRPRSVQSTPLES